MLKFKLNDVLLQSFVNDLMDKTNKHNIFNDNTYFKISIDLMLILVILCTIVNTYS